MQQPSAHPSKKRRTHDLAGNPIPLCSYRGCVNSVYAAGECYFHHRWTLKKKSQQNTEENT